MNEGNGWLLVYEGFDPQREPLREALCALGNGVFVTRGAAEESRADGVHYPGTYLGGGYNRLSTEIAGETIVNEDLVNFPNWLPLTFRPAKGDWLDLAHVDVLDYRQELDMRRGVLSRRMRVRDRSGRETSVASRRLVHMGDPHLAAIEYRITPENWSGHLEVLSELDASVTNAGVARYRDLASKHLEAVDGGEHGDAGVWLLARTTQSRLEMGLSACTRVWKDDAAVDADRRVVREPERIGLGLGVEAREGEEISVEKIVAIYTSRDVGITEPALESREALERCGRFADLLRSHETAWAPARLPHAADHQPQPDRSRHRHPRPRLARGGLPRPRLLGRGLHLPLLQPPLPHPHPLPPPLPLPAPCPRAVAGAAGRLPGGDVSLAEREQRAGGDPGPSPQPQGQHLGPGPQPATAPREHRRRLQRLAVLRRDR
jgi:hypothetical protein